MSIHLSLYITNITFGSEDQGNEINDF